MGGCKRPFPHTACIVSESPPIHLAPQKYSFPTFSLNSFLMFLGRGMDSNLPNDDASDPIARQFTYRSLLDEPIPYCPTRTWLYAPLRNNGANPNVAKPVERHSVTSWVFAWQLVPEAKGRTLEKINEAWR
jgi:hypothetical protein